MKKLYLQDKLLCMKSQQENLQPEEGFFIQTFFVKDEVDS